MKTNVIFTICCFNYLHYALNCRESFLKHNKDYEFVIFIMDWCSEENVLKKLEELNEIGVDIRSFLEVHNGIEYYPIEDMISRYNVLEVNTAIKPFCVEYFFNKGYEKVIYIDPDIQFYSRIEKIDNNLEKFSIILTPHMMSPYPDDGKDQNCQVIMMAGMNNCGFIAFRNSDDARKAVNFWEGKLEDRCYSDVGKGLFTDQRWTDWFPYIFDNVLILKDYGHNMAYWNLHEREVKKKNNEWYVNNDKLVFFHFSGLKKESQEQISKYQNRFTLSDRKDELREIFVEYLDNVDKKGLEFYSKIKYYFSNINNTNCEIRDLDRRNLGKTAKTFVYSKKKVINNVIRYNMPVSVFEYLPKMGLNIIGYVEEMHSVGEVMRQFIDNLLVASIPFSICPVFSGSAKISNKEIEKYRKFYTDKPSYYINILFINLDQINNYYENNPLFFKGKYNIANFWWEFSDGLERFNTRKPVFQAVMCCSDIVKRAVDKTFGETVKSFKFRFPFYKYSGNYLDRQLIRKNLGIKNNDFVFFFNFDFNSSFERKNPKAVLNAFRNAFEKCDDVKIVMKTSNKVRHQNEYNDFISYINKLNLEKSVIIVDAFFTKMEMQSYINACDVYVSLHHSEGFGMGMCEAMSMGKPVIASRYGGNMDFMSENDAILIDCKVEKPYIEFEHYRDVSEWGEPDISKASDAMWRCYSDRRWASEIGSRGKHKIESYFGVSNFKKEVYNLLGDNISNLEPEIVRMSIPLVYENLFFKKVRYEDGRRQIYIFGKLVYQYKR